MAQRLNGDVVSDKGDKTIVVAIHNRKTHPIYKKQYSQTKRIMAHDANNEAKIGDKVTIEGCRPISAKKRWTLVKVVEAAKIKHVEPEQKVVTKPEPKGESA
jgi:small subunit ribosomal protein S17